MSCAAVADVGRRRLLAGLSAATALGAVPFAATAISCAPWREWLSFVAKHVQNDGRVIDLATPDQRSTSEGQGYGLFFALVNDDEPLFERLLGWTRHNLCGDRPDLRLPSWLWGKAADGDWRVLDENSASDADLWIAYTLIEAGRLWERPGYLSAGRKMLALIAQSEMLEVPGLGLMLMPGAEGFAANGRWTFNPSYLPIQQLRCFAAVDPDGPWAAMVARTERLIHDAAPVGFAPDWIAWDGQGFGADPAKGVLGSYDAIRVYLWAGMLDPADPVRQRLLRDLAGPRDMIKAQGRFAEKVDTVHGVGFGVPPVGYAAALLPYLSALHEPKLLHAQLARIPLAAQPAAATLPYYERMLVLFGKGWLEGKFRFNADGRLVPAWRTRICSARI